MNSSPLLLLLGLIGFVVAQVIDNDSGLSSLPQCGQTCITNMLAIATADRDSAGFGCAPARLALCACCNPQFDMGIADCTAGTCGAGTEEQRVVIEYGQAYCMSATSDTACPGNAANDSSFADASSSEAATEMEMSTAATMTDTATTSFSFTTAPTDAWGSAAAAVSTAADPDVYVVEDGQTISAGGDAVSGEDNLTYSALPSGAGVAIMSGTEGMTVTPSVTTGVAASVSDVVSSASDVMSSVAAAATSVISDVVDDAQDSETSEALAPERTAVPAVLGAVAMLAWAW